MKNGSAIRRAAMGALVAAALMASANQAGAGPWRFPEDVASRLPQGRAKILDDGSGGGGMLGRLKLMLAAVRLFPEGSVRIYRFPARVVPRND